MFLLSPNALVSCQCSKELPQTAGLNTTRICYLTDGDVCSIKEFDQAEIHVSRAPFHVKAMAGEFIPLSFPASRIYPHVLAHGHFLHLKDRSVASSDLFKDLEKTLLQFSCIKPS